MRFEQYEILDIKPEVTDVFLLRIKPKRNKRIPLFKPGQYYHIKDPANNAPDVTRAFSVLRSKMHGGFLEFYIKSYGPFTKKLLTKKRGESIWLFGPMGRFTLPDETTHAVFLAGGVGITPALSIIQSLHDTRNKMPITLIYANKSQDTILKRSEIENIFEQRTNSKLIHVISRAKSEKEWSGYRGYIDLALLEREVEIAAKPTFFLSGSQNFTNNMYALLMQRNIESTSIKQEIFS